MIVNTRLLLSSVLVLTMLATSQEVKHAPTFQLCEADLNLWSSQIPGYPTSTSEQDQEGTKAGVTTEPDTAASSSRITSSSEVMTASEVKSHSSIDRFLVVFHSPTGMAETGLLACRSEKTGRASRCNANTKDFLWSGLTMKTSELAGISRDFREKTSGFLCTPDCVAEREGFELSVQVVVT
jgi:hypothetical protein